MKTKQIIIFLLLLTSFIIATKFNEEHYNCCLYINGSVPEKYKQCKICIKEHLNCPIMIICPSSETDRAQFLLVDDFWVPTCCMCKFNKTLY